MPRTCSWGEDLDPVSAVRLLMPSVTELEDSLLMVFLKNNYTIINNLACVNGRLRMFEVTAAVLRPFVCSSITLFGILMDTEGQMGNGMEKSGQRDLKTGLSSRTLKGSKGRPPGLQQEVKEKISLDR